MAGASKIIAAMNTKAQLRNSQKQRSTATTVGTATLYGNHADPSATAMTPLVANRSGDWLFALETIPNANQREIWARKNQGE